jgi:AraC family transcriptional regulator
MKTLPFGTFNGARRSSIDLNGFLLAEFVDRPEDTITLHTHADTHFQFLLQGLYITSATGLGAPCSPPAVIFNPAGTTHRDRFHTRGGSFLALSVTQGVMERIGNNRVLEERAVGFSGGEVLWLGNKIRRELRQCDELSPIVIEGLALELLANVARRDAHRTWNSASWLDVALQQVHDCFRDKLTVQGIASLVGVQPLLLGRSFRKTFGCSLGEMLRRTRIDRAEELLRRHDLPLAEIALATGFADQAQLTKAFKRVTGLTPAVYRRISST